TWKKRLLRAQCFIDNFNPDWLSLQFVPFSFNKKGLPLGLAGKLKKLGKDRSWHIMFHELWVGMIHTTSIRRKALSLIQRKLIKHLADTLKPNIIHTHTHIYKIKLAEKGIIASLMPLFGNIPVSDKLNQKWLPTNNVKYIVFF